ncbi:SAM-MT-RSMB-NOP domain-containing protein [Mycena indigotica]|uniref:SAM-MT-RSMB-NOP domain-containing protein n=1 Tax=Mycena indigotica TaxID=2126181 RepID=A0A8H6WBS5_9AGAR|nr:SAM-MT-RSMB-NOP domain-containing protein [Mycena indigotica]KAF7312122.1 SAM-MT-RSMB-NOP domain-containing protein [Mycena indigotica]
MNFYFECAKTLDRLDAKQGSIKGLIGSTPEKDRKRTAALVIETLKFRASLLEVIKAAQLMKEERKKLTSLNLALVLVHDLLLAGGIQAGDGPIKQAVLRHKARLNGELQKLKARKGVRSNADLGQSPDARAANIPRYVRVNTNAWSLDTALEYLASQGHMLQESLEGSHEKIFAKDAHIPNLLLFPAQTSFLEDTAYKSGKFILQDKASCFPAVVLSPPKNARVIDATAAPGNKTTHLSALMGNTGKLFAFERDRKRFGTLSTMLFRAHCKNVDPINADFLTVDPEDPNYAEVTHILLDPSCSGSGIVNRLDYLLETEEDNPDMEEDRLRKLASFQLTMIKHAMKFPKISHIVYSTCSIHATENEHVVRAALESDEAANGSFVLAPQRYVIPTWHRRGLPNEMGSPDDAQSVIRCSPGEDATNGFFVSCFVKASKKRKTREEDDEERSTTRKKNKEKERKDSNKAVIASISYSRETYNLHLSLLTSTWLCEWFCERDPSAPSWPASHQSAQSR